MSLDFTSAALGPAARGRHSALRTLGPTALRSCRVVLPALLIGGASLFTATTAAASNEQIFLMSRSCSPYIQNPNYPGCYQAEERTFQPSGLNIGGGFSFASGYRGGYALASAIFDPGAAPLLQASRYENGGIAEYSYTLQVKGTPNTLVPLHVWGSVEIGRFHLTDPTGQPVSTFDDLSTGTPPSYDWNITALAKVSVSSPRGSPTGQSSAVTSVEARYTPGPPGGQYCMNCNGKGELMNTVIWVYTNSDVNVTVGANADVIYNAHGVPPESTFATAYASADPVFAIDDPAYAGFTIEGVPTGSAPPIPAVPEPATWALLLGGLASIGTLARRRRAA